MSSVLAAFANGAIVSAVLAAAVGLALWLTPRHRLNAATRYAFWWATLAARMRQRDTPSGGRPWRPRSLCRCCMCGRQPLIASRTSRARFRQRQAPDPPVKIGHFASLPPVVAETLWWDRRFRLSSRLKAGSGQVEDLPHSASLPSARLSGFWPHG